MLAILAVSLAIFLLLPPESGRGTQSLKVYAYLCWSILSATIFYSIISIGIIFVESPFSGISLSVTHNCISLTCAALSLLVIWKKRRKLILTQEIVFSDLKELSFKHKRIYLWCLLCIYVILWFSSIGPINHPDASDYHVGYPYQYLLRNKFFVDGSFSQGMLGLQEYSYNFLIASNSIWLIRCMPMLIVLPAILLLLKTSQNLLSPLFFLTTPLFVQWHTIGKPLFLAEVTLAIIYIIWSRNKNDFHLLLLLSACSIAIACKLSALIIVIPIIIHLVNHYPLKLIYQMRTAVFVIILFIPILIISLIRFHLTGNPIFPLFSDIIIPTDLMAVDFWNAVKQYKVDSDLPFPISLILPSSHENIGTAFGLGLTIYLIMSIFWAEKNVYNRQVKAIALSQFLLILIFGQKRADYYVCPIYLICSLENIKFSVFRYSKISILIALQIIFFIPIAFLSILISIKSFFNPVQTMIETASSYQLYRELNNYNQGGNYLNLVTRTARLYATSNYVSPLIFRNCMEKYPEKKRAALYCFRIFDITTVAINPNDSIEGVYSALSICRDFEHIISRRNPLKSDTITIEICEVDSSSGENKK